MDAFEKAKAKYEKNRERQNRVSPQVEVTSVEIPAKRETPKHKPMVVMISGPAEMVFEIDYAGALMAGQLTHQVLTEMFKKQLAAFGRVRCP